MNSRFRNNEKPWNSSPVIQLQPSATPNTTWHHSPITVNRGNNRTFRTGRKTRLRMTEVTYRSAGSGWPGWGIGRSRTSFPIATTSDWRNYWSPSCSKESATTGCTDRTFSWSLGCRIARRIRSNRTGRTCWWLRPRGRKPRSRSPVCISANQKYVWK